MNKRLKGILAFAFLGGIMLTSGVVIGIPGIIPQPEVTVTGTPQDRFPDTDRPRFCGTDGAKSTPYVQEYEITRKCTQPLAITTDDQGDVWFTQSNTGNLGKFDPDTSEFSEFFNPSWPSTHAMMWGITQHPDGTIWYTEDAFGSIWRYHKDTGAYEAINYRLGNSTLPHRLVPISNALVVNDYTGGRVSFITNGEQDDQIGYWNLFSPLLTGITSEVVFDSQFTMWYTNWRQFDTGFLVNFDTVGYYGAFDVGENDTAPDVDERDFVETIELPGLGIAVNGMAVDNFDNIWMTNSESSELVKYDKISKEFTTYTTPQISALAYGNATGIIENPLSRPYFAEADYLGRIVFNESSANRIGVLDPVSDSLTEYVIPSRNPHWSDCEETDTECGIAQVLAFHTDVENIWFTEWVENNIGVIDTTIEIPYTVTLEPQTLYMDADSAETITMTVDTTEPGPNPEFVMSSLEEMEGLSISNVSLPIMANSTKQTDIEITITDLDDGVYKVALGVMDEEVGQFRYLTINVGIAEPTLEESIASQLSGLTTASGEPISIESIEVVPSEQESEPTLEESIASQLSGLTTADGQPISIESIEVVPSDEPAAEIPIQVVPEGQGDTETNGQATVQEGNAQQ